MRTRDCRIWLPVASGHFCTANVRYPVRSAAAVDVPPSPGESSRRLVKPYTSVSAPGLRIDTLPSMTSDVADTVPSRARELTVTVPGK